MRQNITRLTTSGRPVQYQRSRLKRRLTSRPSCAPKSSDVVLKCNPLNTISDRIMYTVSSYWRKTQMKNRLAAFTIWICCYSIPLYCATLTFYSDRSSWQAATPGYTNIDFEGLTGPCCINILY